MEKRGAGAYIAEFIGTFALVTTIILAASMYALSGNELPKGLSFPFIAAAHVLILLMIIQTLGPISGANFNPAISISLAAIKRISWLTALMYTMVQILGAICAALFAYVVIQKQADAVSYAATTVNFKEINVGSAFTLELLATFFLTWAVVGTAVSDKGDKTWAPFTIAMTLGLGVLLIAPLTGAGINPARSIGPALVSGEWGSASDFLLVYVAGPIVGALIAAFAYAGLYIEKSNEAPAADDNDELSLSL
ncbi:MAG: aquaporin [Thermoleophilaceae bacterium]|nr:aquaporin [Thermoleophilaceae bacterium]